MRDGIFKSLNIGRRWKSFMLCCGREADWGSRADQAAGNALRADLRAELSEAFVAILRRHMQDRQPGIPGIGSDFLSWGDVGGCSSLERLVHTHVSRFSESGMTGHDAVELGIPFALKEWNGQRLRQVEQQLTANECRDARPALREARRALDAQSVMLGSEIMGHAVRPRATRVRIDMDNEDLSSRR
jgi:hypothetical protein